MFFAEQLQCLDKKSVRIWKLGEVPKKRETKYKEEVGGKEQGWMSKQT